MKTTLYRYFDGEGQLLYVGVTGNNTKRQSQHRRNSFWFGEVASATFEYFDTREEALEAETTAIRREKPKYNIAKHGMTILKSPYLHMVWLAGMPDEGHDAMHRDYAAKFQELFNSANGHLPDADMIVAFAMQSTSVDLPESSNLKNCFSCVAAYESEWFAIALKKFRRRNW